MAAVSLVGTPSKNFSVQMRVSTVSGVVTSGGTGSDSVPGLAGQRHYGQAECGERADT